mmetsp:Transcript_548/g.1187  ORF Transcript_548/g.1187 Transcript_548/m.1187 type:complete len:210 (-) Transcript_548:310-939(-)
MASVRTVICGFHPRPRRSRQMSPLVYTCGCLGVGLRKYTDGGLVGYSFENSMRSLCFSPSKRVPSTPVSDTTHTLRLPSRTLTARPGGGFVWNSLSSRWIRRAAEFRDAPPRPPPPRRDLRSARRCARDGGCCFFSSASFASPGVAVAPAEASLTAGLFGDTNEALDPFADFFVCLPGPGARPNSLPTASMHPRNTEAPPAPPAHFRRA